MKKIMVLGLAALLVVMFTIPAAALENVFGGYWRTRFYTQQNFDGHEDSVRDISQVDTRTRLYYTAILNDDLKFVNKFEMDANWGDNIHVGKYGDVGADGVGVEVKNSYVDFNLGPAVNAKVGVQGFALARGFIADDDFSGVVASFKAGNVTIPLVWLKVYEGGAGQGGIATKEVEYSVATDANGDPIIKRDANGDPVVNQSTKQVEYVLNETVTGYKNNSDDFDYYAIAPIIKPSDSFSLQPYVLYATSDDASFLGDVGDADVFYGGLDLNVNMDVASLWFTGIYQGGEIKMPAGYPNWAYDIQAFLLGAGFSANLGPADIHGQAFYATGDDKTTDKDMKQFFVPAGQSYYWAEIMGYGILGDVSPYQVSANSPADQIGNILVGNIGTTFKPTDDLTISFDVWYAKLAEDMVDDVKVEDELGTEVDLVATYQLVQGLKLDIVGAYLFAGDGTYKGENDENPFEVGTRLSLSF